jgi:ammonia channel protein AmtB
LWFSNEGSCLVAALVEKMVESGKGKEEQRLKLGFFFFFFVFSSLSLSLSLGVEKWFFAKRIYLFLYCISIVFTTEIIYCLYYFPWYFILGLV